MATIPHYNLIAVVVVPKVAPTVVPIVVPIVVPTEKEWCPQKSQGVVPTRWCP